MTKKTMSPERLKDLRRILGLSQHKMATLMGYENRASISLFESGQRPISPRVSLLVEMLEDKHKNNIH